MTPNTLPERIFEWQLSIGQWADSVFPERTTASALLKLYSELGEYIRDPSNGEELADILIMMIDLANLNGIDIQEAMWAKHQKNINRKWKVCPVMGTMSHVKEAKLLDDPEGEGSLM